MDYRKEVPQNEKKFFLKRFAVYFMAFFIPTFLLFVIAMVIFGNSAEEENHQP